MPFKERFVTFRISMTQLHVRKYTFTNGRIADCRKYESFLSAFLHFALSKSSRYGKDGNDPTDDIHNVRRLLNSCTILSTKSVNQPFWHCFAPRCRRVDLVLIVLRLERF